MLVVFSDRQPFMNTTIRRAVYAGSFDPPTNGHLWMIREAAALFDELVVALGVNPEKRSTYTIEERQEMLEAVTADLPNVKIRVFENRFLVHFAREVGARFVVRGIRSGSDYEYERTMRYINSDLAPEITTVLLMPPREIAEVSSTMVKGLVGPEGWRDTIGRYVPEAVYRKILSDCER
ncbi:phosphopantetheine adenylyltransferase [Neisseria animalis]|nr:phosphopantetheine adenylyltransferase [Neisseria animalis]